MWRLLAPLNLALIACALLLAGWRLARPENVFYYTEGPVLGSLAALQEAGDLSELYPADAWSEAPTVLTLYPPVYFFLAAAADRLAGSAGTLLGLRLVSAAAFAVVISTLAVLARGRRLPVPWSLALLASTLLTPGVLGVLAGAQPDALALMWTWIGIACGLPLIAARPGDGRREIAAWLGAGACFVLAFFTKQSFISAPAALCAALFLSGRRAAAVSFAAVLGLVGVAGIALLDRLTAGGYAANTIGALTGSFAWENLRNTVAASRPAQWIPLALVVLVGARRLRPGFPELYVAASFALHAAATLKTGSSVNYFLEPTFALVLLATVRTGPDATPRVESRLEGVAAWRRPAVVVLALAVALGAAFAAARELPSARAWLASARFARTADFEGYPLVDPLFFPAVLARDARPWLNDPFAFGALEEIGAWDPSPLVRDLEAGRVPFALTVVDLGEGPAPPGTGSLDLVLAYFWRSPPVWEALTGSYDPTTSGDVTVWLPGPRTRR